MGIIYANFFYTKIEVLISSIAFLDNFEFFFYIELINFFN